jgi:hypothetical protein
MAFLLKGDGGQMPSRKKPGRAGLISRGESACRASRELCHVWTGRSLALGVAGRGVVVCWPPGKVCRTMRQTTVEN